MVIVLPQTKDFNVNTLAENTYHWGWVQGLYLAKNDDGIALSKTSYPITP